MFIAKHDDLIIYRFIWNVVNSNAYVVCCEGSLLIVDSIDSEEFYQFVQQHFVQDALILLTHEHFDHICGLNHLREILPSSRVFASKRCSDNIQSSNKNLSNYAETFLSFFSNNQQVIKVVKPFKCASADITFDTEYLLRWKGHELQFKVFKGHSSGCICYILDNKYMFSGDVLLPIPTVTQLPGGNTKCFWNEDIPKLEALVDNIKVVFPGHGSPGRVEDMLAVNVRPKRYRKKDE